MPFLYGKSYFFDFLQLFFRFSIFVEVLKISGSKIQSTTELSTADMAEDISTMQGSFNRLASVPKFRKYSNLSVLPDPDVRVLQVLKSLEQLPNFNSNLFSRLDEPSKANLKYLLQTYQVSI